MFNFAELGFFSVKERVHKNFICVRVIWGYKGLGGGIIVHVKRLRGVIRRALRRDRGDKILTMKTRLWEPLRYSVTLLPSNTSTA